jgi:glycosyltransferase involved in cell wall biosynthesis
MVSFDKKTATCPHVLWVHGGDMADELYAAQHLETTRELRKNGWRVTLVTSGSEDQRAIRGVEVVTIPRPDVYVIRQLVYHYRVLRLILRQPPSPDIVLFHQSSALWLLPLKLVRRLLGRSKMMLVMDIRTVHMPPKGREGLKGRIRRNYLNLIYGLANRWADGQTAITQRMAEVVGVPPRKLWGTWPSGVTTESFGDRRSRSWPNGNQPVELIYIGTLHYERNLVTLCRAVDEANREGMLFDLSLVGDGTERADLERFSEGTNGRIKVSPSISHEAVPELLARAHVGALPFPDEQKFHVSSPIKLFEYMASGLPVFATRIVCHTDVVGDGRYVFWAESSDLGGLLDGLRRIWQERASLPTMGRLAASAAPAWTWQASARKLQEALARGLEGRV